MRAESNGREGADIDLSLMRRVEDELKAYAGLGLLTQPATDLTTDWRERLDTQPQRFINDDWTINHSALGNFRRLQILVNDIPTRTQRKFDLKSFIGGGHRGQRKMLRECLAVLKRQGHDDLLRKYPCSQVGNPDVFQYQGYRFTHTWFKHTYFLGLLKKVLGSRLAKDFVGLDIGSNCGIFSSLVKKEYPDSHH
ncbi:MAG: hypothetical protein IID32_03270, partial [Planctomycetes bacterium]|nr:hypothetical protein [Planctomycetota bacterium]